MRNTLRVRRAEKGAEGVTQFDVSKALKMHRDRYWRIEKGHTDPTDAEVKAFARYFKCEASVLFPSLATDGEKVGASA